MDLVDLISLEHDAAATGIQQEIALVCGFSSVMRIPIWSGLVAERILAASTMRQDCFPDHRPQPSA